MAASTGSSGDSGPSTVPRLGVTVSPNTADHSKRTIFTFYLSTTLTMPNGSGDQLQARPRSGLARRLEQVA